MACDEHLVARVRDRLDGVPEVVELRMFGGWGVTVRGNMAVGVLGSDLIVRVGPEEYERALGRPGTRPFDFTGRPMRGWVYVEGGAVVGARSLRGWVARGVDYASSLPPKAPKGGSVMRPARRRRATPPR